jgi:hypothetical protein
MVACKQSLGHADAFTRSARLKVVKSGGAYSSPTLNRNPNPNLFPSNMNKGGLRLRLGLRLGGAAIHGEFLLRSPGVVLGFALPERRNVRLFVEAEKQKLTVEPNL